MLAPARSSYAEHLSEVLRPAKKLAPLVIDLFAGCGGLSLGFEAQGFETLGFEKDEHPAATYRRNLGGRCEQVLLTPETELPAAQVVIGGPPCQPFSVRGHQQGLGDSRDGFPVFISAVRRIQPEIWMFENVRGMLYKSRSYLDEVLSALRSMSYVVEIRMLNAVDFGVPQNRERLVVVGHRSRFTFPSAVRPRVTAGEAVGDLVTQIPPDARFLTQSMDEYVARYEKASCCTTPRDLHLNAPARTLTCRNLAGATSDMQRVRLADGRRRRLLLREAARLQSFPDWFEFTGGETSAFNQVGNSVAPLFGYHLAGSIRRCLESGIRLSRAEIDDANRQVAQPRQLPLL